MGEHRSVIAALAFALCILFAIKAGTMWRYGAEGVVPYAALSMSLLSLAVTAHVNRAP